MKTQLVAPLAIRLRKNGCDHWFEKGYCINCKLPSLYQIERERQAQEKSLPQSQREELEKLRNQRKVYNPRSRQWEFEDGTPTEGPDEKPEASKVFHFGEYTGLKIEEVPTSYLQFCVKDLRSLNNAFKKAIERELEKRLNR